MLGVIIIVAAFRFIRALVVKYQLKFVFCSAQSNKYAKHTCKEAILET